VIPASSSLKQPYVVAFFTQPYVVAFFTGTCGFCRMTTAEGVAEEKAVPDRSSRNSRKFCTVAAATGAQLEHKSSRLHPNKPMPLEGVFDSHYSLQSVFIN
jgi:hypothetical protein